MIMLRHVKALLLVIVLFAVVSDTTIVITGEGATEIKTASTSLGPSDFMPVNGTAKIISPSNGCSQSEGLTGFVAIIEPDNCYPYTKAKNAQTAGAIAVLLIGYRDTVGLLKYYRGFSDEDDVTIPVIEVWRSDEHGVEDGDHVTITPAGNPISDFGVEMWILFTFILLSYDLSITVVALYKVLTLRKLHRLGTLPMLTIGLVFFTTLLRIPLLIDPTGMLGIYPWGIIEFFLTIDFSFTICGAFLIASYTTGSLRSSSKLLQGPVADLQKRKYVIPGIVLIVALLIIELTTSIMRGLLLPAMPFLIGKALLYFISSFSAAVIFILMGVGVLKTVKKVTGKLKPKFKAKAIIGFVIAVCLIIFPLNVISVISPLNDSPFGYILNRFLTALELYTASLCQLLLFDDSSFGSPSSSKSNSASVNNQDKEKDIELNESSS